MRGMEQLSHHGSYILKNAINENLLHQTLERHVVTEASAVAKKAEELEISKYTHLDASHKFILVTNETNQCCFLPQSINFMNDLDL